MIKLRAKKLLIFITLLATLLLQTSFVQVNAADEPFKKNPARLKDIIITLSMPLIRIAVNSFYEPYLDIKPSVVPYSGSEIISIQGEYEYDGIRNSHYIVIIDVIPYIGPHLSVGKDRITLNIKPSGATVEKYEHLLSYILPPNYQQHIKKPLP